jgi:hypothetical protein
MREMSEGILMVYCMHIFEVHPEVILPSEEIVVAILNPKHDVLVFSLRLFQVASIEFVHLCA